MLASGPSRREQVVEVRPRELRIAQDLRQQPGADGLTGVDGNRGSATIGMPEEVMAATYPHHREPRPGERPNEVLTCNGEASGHRVVRRTRWTPTNSRRGGGESSSSMHNSMTSLTRSINSSSERACVWHPGRPGTVATRNPSASRSTTTSNSRCMLGLYAIHLRDPVTSRRQPHPGPAEAGRPPAGSRPEVRRCPPSRRPARTIRTDRRARRHGAPSERPRSGGCRRRREACGQGTPSLLDMQRLPRRTLGACAGGGEQLVAPNRATTIWP